MEAICSFETLSLIRIIQLYNPEDRTVRSHRCDNLKSKIIIYFIHRVSVMSSKDSSRQQRIGLSSEAYRELLKSTSYRRIVFF
jgi:hypothetical protein